MDVVERTVAGLPVYFHPVGRESEDTLYVSQQDMISMYHDICSQGIPVEMYTTVGIFSNGGNQEGIKWIDGIEGSEFKEDELFLLFVEQKFRGCRRIKLGHVNGRLPTCINTAREHFGEIKEKSQVPIDWECPICFDAGTSGVMITVCCRNFVHLSCCRMSRRCPFCNSR